MSASDVHSTTSTIASTELTARSLLLISFKQYLGSSSYIPGSVSGTGTARNRLSLVKLIFLYVKAAPRQIS